MQRRLFNAPDGADEPEIPVLRGVLPIVPVAPQIRPANPAMVRNPRRITNRNRSESPETAIEYDENEVNALKRMREVATLQMNGLASLIGQDRQDTSFIVVNDDVRAVREAEERRLIKEMDDHLQLIQKGNINRAAILMLMTPLCNFVERIEMELKNTGNLLKDIEARQLDIVEEMRHVERIAQILEKDDRLENHCENP